MNIKKHVFIRMTAVLMILVMIFSLSGCGIAGKMLKIAKGISDSGKNDDGEKPETAVTTDKPTDTDDTAVSKPSAVPEKEEEPEVMPAGDGAGVWPKDADVSKLSEVYLKSRENLHWKDNSDLIIDYEYEQIELGEKDKERYPDLAKSLLIVNDLIATDEGNLFMSDVKSLQDISDEDYQEAYEDDRLPLKAHWNIYLRRADSKVTSLVVQNILESSFDYDRVQYTGYNYLSETGEELSLSDIVADEDAFLEVLKKKTAEELKREEPDLFGDEDPDLSLINDYLHPEARGNWTMDPQGITVWFNAYTFIPFDVSVTILFSEDTDGTLFKDEWKTFAPIEWIMYIPLNRNTVFDVEEDGKPDYLTVYDHYDMYEEDSYEFIDGLSFLYNGAPQTVTGWGDRYDTRLALVHKPEKTFVLDFLHDYDYAFMNMYELSGGKVEDIGYIQGSPATIPYEEWDEDDYRAPFHL
ncbi:MAG: DUF3298 domain-containing protein, partial [Lachnospiraceae bacterium]|nr:DUF3298 domain-containing protein [Lachnospiraceae bacterium]